MHVEVDCRHGVAGVVVVEPTDAGLEATAALSRCTDCPASALDTEAAVRIAAERLHAEHEAARHAAETRGI
jgi:hypothetical protein